MSHTQVITIEPGGAMSGLQRKPGQGLDLRQFSDKADITRASEIMPTRDGQAWYVDILQDAGCGPLTSTKWREAGCEGFPDGADHSGLPGGIYSFREYDDAVRAEIKFLDALRLQGKF